MKVKFYRKHGQHQAGEEAWIDDAVGHVLNGQGLVCILDYGPTSGVSSRVVSPSTAERTNGHQGNTDEAGDASR